MELQEWIGKKVNSKEELADFVDDLLLDLMKNPKTWENLTLEHFLESMAAWLRDSSKHQKQMGGTVDQPSWGTFAKILGAAKIYE